MSIRIGSDSALKIKAVKLALEALGYSGPINGEKVPSVVNEQPMGPEETYRGALHRANAAFDTLQQRESEVSGWAVGIESGVIQFGEVYLDLAVVVVLGTNGERACASSEGIEFSEDAVQVAQRHGFGETTVGSVVANIAGCDPDNPHSLLTKGRLSRENILANAVRAAFLQTSFGM